jgi:hypothetical protein
MDHGRKTRADGIKTTHGVKDFFWCAMCTKSYICCSLQVRDRAVASSSVLLHIPQDDLGYQLLVPAQVHALTLPPQFFSFSRFGTAGVAARVLERTRRGDCLTELTAYVLSLQIPRSRVLSSLLSMTTPINPALKPDRRGIGKKISGSSAYAAAFVYRPELPYSALAVTVEQASLARPATAVVKSQPSKNRKERDDKLRVRDNVTC